MNHRTYVIIDAADVENVEFNEVLESSNSLRWNLADPPTQTVVKFEGDTPSFLEGLTAYSHPEILNVMATSAWSRADPP